MQRALLLLSLLLLHCCCYLFGIVQSQLTNDFVPLACNANLDNVPCISWRTIYGNSDTFTNQVIIPCGTCIVMDYPGPQLSLLRGINIIGKLIFPDSVLLYKITIYTASIIVQGELDMQSTKQPITGTPLITFIMIGLDETLSFRPVNENANACVSTVTGNCLVGFKSITVAGGTVKCTCCIYEYYLIFVVVFFLFCFYLF
jgi:hypothetical protein